MPLSDTDTVDPVSVFGFSSVEMAAAGGTPTFNNLTYLIILVPPMEFPIRLEKQSVQKVITDT